MQTKNWSELASWQKAVVIEVALVQIGLFVAAWTDLRRRPAEQVNGRKQAWHAALFLNTVGPLAYFFKGRRQST